MSDKSDRDNHSNQLNPNNSAYRSSRGIGGDDDDDGYCGKSGTWRLSDPMATQRVHERAAQYRQRFEMDLVMLSGESVCLSVICQAVPLSGMDCVDIAEKIYMRALHTFTRETNSTLAWSEVRDEQGNPLIWLGGVYRPRKAEFGLSQEKLERIERDNALWERTGRVAVEKFRAKQATDEKKPRENIGEYTYEQVRFW